MTARDWALIELDRRVLPGWPRGCIRRAGRAPLPPPDPRDRALAEQILTGTIKNLLLLQHLIVHFAQRRLDQVEPPLQKIIAIGLYQLRFLDRVPEAAAVNEAVEQARRFGISRGSGLVNAVLRKASRGDAIPLPARDRDPAAYAAIALSHPPELYARLEHQFGPETAMAICEHDNAQPPTIVRLMRRANPAQLDSPGVIVLRHQQAGMYVVQGARQPLLAHWAQQGVAQVQDPTAALVVETAELLPGQTVLDRCAGLGTKTLQMAEYLGPDGQLIAIDPSAARCQALRQLAQQRGIPNLRVYRAGRLGDAGSDMPAAFDRALVDVPCSNSGVLARRPEARYAQSAAALRSLARLQRGILDDTAAAVAPGGLLVYSTCSIWFDENQQRVAEFIAAHDQYALVHERATLPSAGSDPTQYRDGGYSAVLRRIQ